MDIDYTQYTDSELSRVDQYNGAKVAFFEDGTLIISRDGDPWPMFAAKIPESSQSVFAKATIYLQMLHTGGIEALQEAYSDPNPKVRLGKVG